MLKESGPGVRPVAPDRVRSIRDRCIDASVLFFKQWGGVHKKVNGRNLDGRTWDQLPHLLVTQAIVVHHHASSVPLGPRTYYSNWNHQAALKTAWKKTTMALEQNVPGRHLAEYVTYLYRKQRAVVLLTVT